MVQILLVCLLYIYLYVAPSFFQENQEELSLEKYFQNNHTLEFKEYEDIYFGLENGTIQIYNQESIKNTKLLILIDGKDTNYRAEQREILTQFKQITEGKNRLG